MSDTSENDILVNGPDQVFVERNGVLEKTETRFRDELNFMRIIDKIVRRVGLRIDDSKNMVDDRI